MRRLGDMSERWANVDASCGPMDASYQELWGPAALARAQRNDLETPLENELGLLRAMRKRCGPFASVGRMVTHLRSARGKLHWSVNGYFRETVLDAGGSVDFAPRPSAREDAGRGATDGEEEDVEHGEEGHEETPSLPSLVWEMLLSRVTLPDVCRLARVSRLTRDVARSNAVWRAQFVARWGEPAACRVAAARFAKRRGREPRIFHGGEGFDGSGGGRPGFAAGDDVDDDGVVPSSARNDPVADWKDEYRQRHERERKMTCPECHAARVTPIVYGFPSPQLVTALKKQKVLLGGDYLVEGDPSWACRACQSRWRAWPFAWPAVGPEQESLGVAPHPGISGKSGCGPGLGTDLDDAQPLPEWELEKPPFIRTYTDSEDGSQ